MHLHCLIVIFTPPYYYIYNDFFSVFFWIEWCNLGITQIYAKFFKKKLQIFSIDSKHQRNIYQIIHKFFRNLKEETQNPHPDRSAPCRPSCCATPATRASSRPPRCSCSRGSGTSSPVRRKQGRQAVRGVHALPLPLSRLCGRHFGLHRSGGRARTLPTIKGPESAC
jgi:hypothetical protein